MKRLLRRLLCLFISHEYRMTRGQYRCVDCDTPLPPHRSS